MLKLLHLWTSIMTFLASIILLINFDFNQKAFNLKKNQIGYQNLGIVYHLGIDGISLPFILLTTFLNTNLYFIKLEFN